MSDLEHAIDIYKQARPVETFLPLHARGFDFTLDEVHGHCPQCGKELVHLRGTIVDYGNCIDIRMTGICEDEKTLVSMKPMRYYADGHFMWCDGVSWVTGVERETLVSRIKRLFSRKGRK